MQSVRARPLFATWAGEGVLLLYQLALLAAAVFAVASGFRQGAESWTLYAGYIVVAFAGELLLLSAHTAEAAPFGVALLLVAVAAGDGSAAAPIAAAILLARLHICPRTDLRWLLAASIYPVAAGFAWAAASRLPMPQAGVLRQEALHLPTVVAVALIFLVTNVALTTLLLAAHGRDDAVLRLRQHGARLLLRFALIGAGAWAAVTVCDLFFNHNGPYLILATFAGVAIAVARQRQNRLASRRAVTALIAAIDAKDPYTGGHVVRVGALAAALAGELGQPADAIDKVGFAASIHDLGKIAVPLEVLHCAGPLDPASRSIVEQHARSGEQLLRGLIGLPEAALVAGGHHERWDGRGYPRGLTGAATPLPARITAVADSWDAMTSDRPYRRALADSAAWSEIERGSGSQFDPAVVAAFARLRAGSPPLPGQLNPDDRTPLTC